MSNGAVLVGGNISFHNLTIDLLKDNDKSYAILKAKCWLKMINDGMKAKKWLTPNKKGTSVKFETIKTKEEYDIAIRELKEFIDYVNRTYGTGIKLEY